MTDQPAGTRAEALYRVLIKYRDALRAGMKLLPLYGTLGGFLAANEEEVVVVVEEVVLVVVVVEEEE